MSRENVELVRRAYGEFLSRGELPLPLVHPELRIDNVPESPIPGPYHGHEGLRRWWREVSGVLEGMRLELDETIDVGGDCVVGLVRFVGHTPAGFDLSAFPWVVVHWIEDGLIVRTAGFLTKEQALEAAGRGD
jgi:hypothetical protein